MTLSDIMRKYLVLAGCTMLIMPISVHLTFGNILTYLLSYYNGRTSLTTEWLNPLWAPTIFLMAHSLGMLFSIHLESCRRAQNAIIFGAVLISASVLVTYYTIVEPIGFILTFGALQGLGGGLVMALALKLLTEVMPEDIELAFTVAWTGPGFYALIHILMAYYLINPTNQSPQIIVGNLHHFHKTQVTDNVPPFFLKIGLLTLILELLGYCLIQFGKDDNANQTDCVQESADAPTESLYSGDAHHLLNNSGTENIMFPNYGTSGDNLELKDSNAPNKTKMGIDNITTPQNSDKAGMSSTPNLDASKRRESENTDHHNKQVSMTQEGPNTVAASSTNTETSTYDSAALNSTASNTDLSPQQILGLGKFWKLWFMTILMGHAFFIHINLYKQHGLTHVHSDKLLTVCGVIGLALLITIRPLCAVLVNKIGLKILLLILCAASNILTTLLPITLSRITVLYVLCVVLQFCALLLLFHLITLLPMLMFGPLHYSVNLGLLNTALIFIYIIDSFLTPALIQHAGWYILYITGTLSSTLGFFLCLAIPQKDLQMK